MSFTTGNTIKLSVFGSSHGSSVNSILEGLPSGLRIDKDHIRKWMSYRRPGSSDITTQRKEEDVVVISSGLHNGVTDGSPVSFSIDNVDAISSHYEKIRNEPRPGHADLTLWQKYGDARNYEGGGFLSGRMTAPLVAAGSVCMQILESRDVHVISWQHSIGNVSLPQEEEPLGVEDCYNFKTRIPSPQKDKEAEIFLKKLMKEGNSIGGTIDTKVTGVPPGIGEPFFDSVESTLSKLMFSIPGLKAIEFGSGFRLAELKGSEAVDEIDQEDGRIVTKSNHNGGILGGISNGMPIKFRVAMKPTSSIRSDLATVDLRTHERKILRVTGRHDPCISIRAVPVVQTLTALGICDLAMQAQLIPRNI